MKELLLIFSIPIITAIICVVIHNCYKEDQKERLNYKKLEHKDNTWTLFRTDPEKANFGNTHGGIAIINGQEYWLNAKTVTSDKGVKFFSGTVKLKQPKNYGEQNDTTRNTQEQSPNEPEDRIPF